MKKPLENCNTATSATHLPPPKKKHIFLKKVGQKIVERSQNVVSLHRDSETAGVPVTRSEWRQRSEGRAYFRGARYEERGERREERGERIEKSVLIRVICAKKLCALCLCGEEMRYEVRESRAGAVTRWRCRKM